MEQGLDLNCSIKNFWFRIQTVASLHEPIVNTGIFSPSRLLFFLKIVALFNEIWSKL